MFQYTVRLLNGITCKANRTSLNQQALIRAARIWVKEFEDFKKGCQKFCIIPPSPQQPRSITHSEKIGQSKADSYSDAIKEVMCGHVYPANNQYTMMREQPVSIFNPKRCGEHRYPRQRN